MVAPAMRPRTKVLERDMNILRVS
jgi:hypothetical protein